jgi:hypothetical protein
MSSGGGVDGGLGDNFTGILILSNMEALKCHAVLNLFEVLVCFRMRILSWRWIVVDCDDDDDDDEGERKAVDEDNDDDDTRMQMQRA